MARAALGLGIRELAVVAKVSIDTVVRFERGDGLKERTIEALQRALETAGIGFTNGDKPGVRLSSGKVAGLREPEEGHKSKAAEKVPRRRTPRRKTLWRPTLKRALK